MAVPWRSSNSFYRKYLYNYVLLYKNRADVKIFLEIILSLITVIVFGLFAIRPTFVTIATLLTEIKTKEDISLQLDQKISNISTAQELVERNQDRIALLHSAIPSIPTPHTYVRQVEGLTIKNSVKIEQLRMENVTLVGETKEEITPSFDEDTPDILVLPPQAGAIEFSLSASGNYLSLLAFLKDIQNARRPFVIDSFSITNVVESSQEKVVLTLTGRVPYINLVKPEQLLP